MGVIIDNVQRGLRVVKGMGEVGLASDFFPVGHQRTRISEVDDQAGSSSKTLEGNLERLGFVLKKKERDLEEEELEVVDEELEWEE